ncbi:MAG: alanine--tRNA ligase [bacterium]
MNTTEIRRRFLDYFKSHGHREVSSSSLVPGNDPTLLFTNAGMVQFKDLFLGDEKRDYLRAVTSQRCVRAGGKHNDLENVGYTARHLTFFEMLGNFSFGDYFKEDAIKFAWELLTVEFGIPAEKLWITVFEEDDEAESIWLNQIGIPLERIARIGAKDNFWQMGDTGPCGPCSEIFYDHGSEVEGGPPGTPEEDGDRYVEIWNLVFMQFDRSSSGDLKPLPKPSVDTGMGLERISAVLQHVHSNYEIDLFQNLIRDAANLLDESDLESKSLRVIADHIRSTSFLIADGVIPSNEGRGYVLRRIIRRAIRHGYQLGSREPFLHKLVGSLVTEMGDAYPELTQKQSMIERVLRLENEKFNETLDQGLKILDREIHELQTDTLDGEVVFKLYDTFGFPVDLTADVAREYDLSIDQDGFEAAMAAQRERARAASQFVQGDKIKVEGIEPTRFCGYDNLNDTTNVVALVREQNAVDFLEDGDEGILVLEATPFYAESGGQIGDQGKITFDSAGFDVLDTHYLANKVIGHFGRVSGGRIEVGQIGTAEVSENLRSASANNHSATHLLHAALKAVLGSHVQQKGSLVEPARLRFDFSHHEVMSPSQLSLIESMVNEQIRRNFEVCSVQMDLEEAKSAGAEALFGEKYDSQVRTIRMGEFSFELCGGTHVTRTGDIGLFKIISESGVAAGVRRIEAISGIAADQYVSNQLSILADASASLKISPEQLSGRIQSMLESQKELQKQIQGLQAKLATGGSSADAVREIKNVRVAAIRQDDADAKTMRLTVDQWKNKLNSGIVVVAGAKDGKVTIIAGVSKDLTIRIKAGDLIGHLAPIVGGKGGGKAELAQGGGSDIGSVDKLINATYEWVENSL